MSDLDIPLARFRVLKDETLNDNDKEQAVPAGYRWRVLGVFVDYTSTATSGNRYVEIQLRDTDDTVFWKCGADAIPASSSYQVVAVPGIGKSGYWLPLPDPCILDAGMDIRVVDVANVDSNDDMKVYINVLEVKV